MYDESNLKVLCYDCHAATHQTMRQSTKDIHHEREAQRVERFLRATVGDEGDGLHTGAIIFPEGVALNFEIHQPSFGVKK